MSRTMSTPDAPTRDETALLRDLRSGDEEVFRHVVLRHQPGLCRVARMYVSEAIADEVIQETWAAVVAGLDHT